MRRTVATATTAAVACGLALVPLTAASAAIVDEPIVYSAPDAAFALTPVGSYETGVFDESAAEIVHAHGDRLFVVNAQAGMVDVLDFSDPSAIERLYSIGAPGVANSVAIRSDGLGVIAFEDDEKTAPGRLVFFDADADEPTVLGAVTVGALPDMVAISADGAYAVVANEGEPADDFSSDPEGSVGVVTLPETKAAPAQDAVRIADFHAFEGEALPDGVRVFGPTPETDYPVSRNLEPEYVAIDGGIAYTALQENNAVAVVDLATATVTDIWPLGAKDHGVEGNGIDPSDRDPRDAPSFDIRTVDGLYGLYMPDGINSYRAGDATYLVTANEGDAREWGDYTEASRVKDLADDGYGDVCADSPLADLTGDADLGRLNVTIENGFDAAAGCYDELYAFGARSFSIWNTAGEQVFDSGDDFETITHAAAPDFFNSNHSESNLEGRSDDKGPEPENLAIGQVGERTYAFIGLERVGGIIVYDITDPAASTFVTYLNNRDFSISVEDADDPESVLSAAGDLGPEGIEFIAAADSPTGEPLLAVGNEVSGTTTLFAIDDGVTDIQVLTINDFHGRIEADTRGVAGAAVVAGAVAQKKAENPNTLFVSAGDNIGASTFTSFIQDDEPTIEALLAAGLDVSAVGNHEFDRGFADLSDRVITAWGEGERDAGLPYALGANVYERGTENPVLPEYAIEDVDGVRIAFIGTVTQDTATMVSPTGIAGIEFGDQREAADRVAAEIAENDLADVTILLTHSGSAVSGDCAAVAADGSGFGELIRGASSEIDAIVSAHTHQTYSCDIAIDGAGGEVRPVVQAAQYGEAMGQLDLRVDSATNELLSISSSTFTLEGAFPAVPAVQEIVDEAVEVADDLGSAQVGSITEDILRGGAEPGSDRGVESSMGNTLADMYLWATSGDDYTGTPAQIGMINPGGLRDDLRYGEDGTVSYRDIANVQPFANTIVTIELTGAQLEQVLEEQWQPGAERPKLHLGVSEGFSYEYDDAAAAGEHIRSMSLNGERIAADEVVVVATNSFLAGGGDSFVTFAEGANSTDTGQVDLAASVAYFKANSPVAPAPLGRAVAITGAPTEPTEPTDPGTELPGTGDEWAEVSVGSGVVEQGGTLDVVVSGLEPGQRITATLFSDPIVVEGIPAADADGRVAFSIAIPADLELGEHTLVIESTGFSPIDVEIEVVPAGALAVTGTQLPLGIMLLSALLVVAGGALTVRRSRMPARV